MNISTWEHETRGRMSFLGSHLADFTLLIPISTEAVEQFAKQDINTRSSHQIFWNKFVSKNELVPPPQWNISKIYGHFNYQQQNYFDLCSPHLP